MSEYINNREYRQKVLKELIMELHNGVSVDAVKERFGELIQGISTIEISEMESALIKEGMPVAEIQRLCDVHAAVFKGSIEEIHRPQNVEEISGHPVHTFKLENRELEKLINIRIKAQLQELKLKDSSENINGLIETFDLLWSIDKHYLRKENLLFPYMEKYEITAPPKVMWGVDDEIRNEIKKVNSLLKSYNGNKEQVVNQAEEVTNRIIEMIFKEENILFPMVLDTLAEDEWVKILDESDEIGYCLIEPKSNWRPTKVNVEKMPMGKVELPSKDGNIKFDTGILSFEEINGMLNTLPLDISFVDKNGVVKYFTQGKERIFPRTKAIIGRLVQNCHPPASVHVVEEVVEDLKSGKKDHEDFWIKMGEQYVLIRYYAVRNENGEFLGTMEVTQNIKPIQEITGEKRLISE